jgi:hypothetical protein
MGLFDKDAPYRRAKADDDQRREYASDCPQFAHCPSQLSLCQTPASSFRYASRLSDGATTFLPRAANELREAGVPINDEDGIRLPIRSPKTPHHLGSTPQSDDDLIRGVPLTTYFLRSTPELETSSISNAYAFIRFIRSFVRSDDLAEHRRKRCPPTVALRSLYA